MAKGAHVDNLERVADLPEAVHYVASEKVVPAEIETVEDDQ